MKKTLYVSDLDGTLFNKKKRISDRTAQILNQCIEKGAMFSVATARMPYGCDYRLKNIQMNIPGILTNGVFLYDFSRKEYVMVQPMEKRRVSDILKIFQRFGKSCFLYTYRDSLISIYYEKEGQKAQTQYYSDQALKSCREIKKVNSCADILEEEIPVYLAVTDTNENLKPMVNELREIPGIQMAYYLNIYNGLYCLEIFSENASKKQALLQLKKMTDCDEVVVFGDNLNDLPMIEIADRSYAPANALEEIKEQVNQVLCDCDHDGVAEFMKKEILESE